jgi:hypothetical protein
MWIWQTASEQEGLDVCLFSRATLTVAGVQHEGCYKEQNLQLYLVLCKGGVGNKIFNYATCVANGPGNTAVQLHGKVRDYEVRELPELRVPGTIMVQIKNNQEFSIRA